MKRNVGGTVARAVLFLLPMVGLVGSARARDADPDSIDIQMDVGGLSAEELKLLRGAVLARHCYYFRDGHLRGAFETYQQQKCGRLYWDEPQEPFDSSQLTAAEKALVARVEAQEKRLETTLVRLANGRVVSDRRSVVNLSQFSTLPPVAMDRLLNTGFVVLPAKHAQLFHVYERNTYKMIPSFVTTDSVLQLYHLYFDYTLREIETDKLLPTALALAHGMRERLRSRLQAPHPLDKKEELERALLYFAVAERLLDGLGDEKGAQPTTALAPPDWMPMHLRERFLSQIKLIVDRKGKARGPIMGMVDYTMFKPRGHYTRSAELERYFRGMMWLGLPGFALEGPHSLLDAALVVGYELTHDPQLMAKYKVIYEPTGFYVGPSDDITPMLLRVVADEICGPDAAFEEWLSKKEKITRELCRRNPARVRTQHNDERDVAQLRFMGMRYVPDSEILQRLTNWPKRPVPTGLDIFGVMGVPAALELLRAADIAWKGYWPEMERLQAQLGPMQPKDAPNLYWRWMHALRTLNQPPPKGAAAFMHTAPWAFKNLNTALASWSELRHDTILYAKPSGAECGGMGPPRVVGYVEARPAFFAELRDLQRYTLDELRTRGILTDDLSHTGSEILKLLEFLADVSQKEVDGQALSDEEYESIRIFGAWLERLTVDVLLESGDDWLSVKGPDALVAVVADVHTAGGTALEEAVGLADEIYALVPIEGHLYLTRGAVFSYYEFEQPASNRLTDEQWQKLLGEGKAPPRPAWTERFLVDEPAPELPERYRYVGC